jgi:hypothetical protein
MQKTWAAIWSVLKWVIVGLVVVTCIVFAVTGKFNLGGIIEAILGIKNRPQAKINNNPILGGQVVPVLVNTDPLRNKHVLQLADGTEIELADKSIIDTQVRAVILVPGKGYYVQTHDSHLTDVFDAAGIPSS